MLKQIKPDPIHFEQKPTDWTKGFIMTKEEIDQIADPDWVVLNMFIQSHLVAISAEANAGKTTIVFHLAGEMAANGFEVLYINADIAGGDAKGMWQQAQEKGVNLLLPDFKGKNMMQVRAHLENMASKENADYSDIVLIVDTLKKFVDLMSKGGVKMAFNLFRKLNAKGMTVITLGHVNKHKIGDKPIFEGVGDIRNDVDELIYFLPVKNDDGSITVSIDVDKGRGNFEPTTFTILSDRSVRREKQFIDTANILAKKAQYKKDIVFIDSINAALDDGCKNQKEIIDFCSKKGGVGKNSVLNVLQRYSGRFSDPWLWRRDKQFKRNTLIYEKVPPLD